MNGQSLEKEKEILALIEKNSQENLIISKQIEKFQNLLKEDEKKNSQNNILVHGEIDQMNEKMMNINKKIESLENIASVKNQRGSIIPKKKTIDEKSLGMIVLETQVESPRYEDIEKELKMIRSQIDLDLISMKSEILKNLEDFIKPITEKLNDSKKLFENTTLELKEKLSWLPINLSELNGMNPSAARLFTIEARLRAEENSRIQALSNIEKSLETIKKSTSPHIFRNDKKASENHYSFDFFNRQPELNEKKNNNSMMEGIIYGSYDNRRNKSSMRLQKSNDFNKINPRKFLKSKL